MKVFAIYMMSFIMLATVLFNAQGVFIEHHQCEACVSPEFHNHSEDNSCSASCQMQDEGSYGHKKEHCDLFNFDDKAHRSSCACFADFVQIPVFYSHISNALEEILVQDLFWISLFYIYNSEENETSFINSFVPPDIHYQSPSKQLLYCTFLC
jgi:hypothetical protein